MIKVITTSQCSTFKHCSQWILVIQLQRPAHIAEHQEAHHNFRFNARTSGRPCRVLRWQLVAHSLSGLWQETALSLAVCSVLMHMERLIIPACGLGWSLTEGRVKAVPVSAVLSVTVCLAHIFKTIYSKYANLHFCWQALDFFVWKHWWVSTLGENCS